ncbi:MAG: zinc ABC transporter substrate-binding protein, partial [Bacteroidota bacterium]
NNLFITVLILFTSISIFGQAKKKIAATASMFKDMAEAIVGDRMDVETIVPIGSDPHLHEPTPRDAKLVVASDLILMNGLTFEGWLNELVDNSGTKAKTILITEGVKPIASEAYANSFDPHAWMDAKNVLVYIKNIYDAVVELDPENKDVYTFNYNAYKTELEDLEKYIQREVAKIPEEQRILITSHDAFQYFGRAYGIKLESIVGVSTEAEAQTSDIIRLNKIIRENHVPAVFIESTINPKLLEQLAKDNDIQIGGKLFADSLDDPSKPGGTFTGMLKANTDIIVEALSKPYTETSSTEKKEESTTNWLLYGLLGAVLLGGFLYLMFRLNKNAA